VTVSSPLSGSVIDLQVAPGAFWHDRTAPLMTLADLSSIWVTANVPEKYRALISKGHEVEVAFVAYPDEVFKGEVLFVSNELDPDTRDTKVHVSLANPYIRLKLNMSAKITFFMPKARGETASNGTRQGPSQ
jgi:cobalt-zinc-cadmium efflux system membrane fusion protein